MDKIALVYERDHCHINFGVLQYEATFPLLFIGEGLNHEML